MEILPKIKDFKEREIIRPPTRNSIVLRPIAPQVGITKAPEPAILPSIRGGATIEHIGGTIKEIKEVKKRKKPTKEEKKKAKLEKASERIRELIESDPSKADILQYFEDRIEELEFSDTD